jgi:hypothetical protein
MNQYRVIYRILRNGSYDSVTLTALDKATAETAVLEMWGDDPIKIVSVTEL